MGMIKELACETLRCFYAERMQSIGRYGDPMDRPPGGAGHSYLDRVCVGRYVDITAESEVDMTRSSGSDVDMSSEFDSDPADSGS